MATFAGRRLADMAENTAGILGIELLSVCQGLDFRSPLKSSEPLEKAKSMLREKVPFYDKDRYFAPDIHKATELVVSGRFNELIGADLLPSFTQAAGGV
jgi:histidine ammonia-lyase